LVPKDLSFEEKIAKIQRYLPEGLTEKILSQRDRIEGERKRVTVMFCDMEGFTALTQRLGPEEACSVMDKVYEILIHASSLFIFHLTIFNSRPFVSTQDVCSKPIHSSIFRSRRDIVGFVRSFDPTFLITWK